MRYMVERNFIEVLGHGWYGQLMCYTYDLRKPYDTENIGEFTRENVELWLRKNAGDFQNIIDFYATIGDQEINWEKEESELQYNNMMYGEE